ncbi:hypothetical protein CFC21_015918 [Triticum aestivum]|uniref:Uncharacterized protein n=3 Tax=Triticum TaxID=4564 RepID=A0A9R1NMK6_TRITD|nr:protein RALF-like 33 [Triticum dicoccoides]XP_044452912.1 protein RALF-like 33 [Triticum aestivum]XP_048560617.1 protein RALF-like 33 [Triticum urartu]KAF6999948.1 hypothetical protein CFC21_015918 [Triticum aestivum]VAH27710.1 unnamed protein product [Triticum turgidum subsp. durum]
MARLGVALLALLAAAAAVACLPSPASAGELASMLLSRAAACDGIIGECGVDEDEEMAPGAGEALRRSLARKSTARYISYAALRADQIPCDKRGASYYINCGSMQQANPYTRGCSAITHCARNMN